MRFPKLQLLPVLLALVSACLEPGPTPLGPEVVETPIPPDAVLFERIGAAALGLEVSAWEPAAGEEIPLFETDVLACGFDSTSGFRAEPLWLFDPAEELAEFEDGVRLAWLQLNYPAHADSFPQDGDNPDLGEDVRARLWRLPAWPDEESALSSPLDLGGAEQIPLYIPGTEELDYEPFTLLSGTDLDLPPQAVEGWIQAGEELILALEWVDPDESGVGSRGMVRLYSVRSTAPDADTRTAALLKIEDQSGTQISTEAVDDGQAAGRGEPGTSEEGRLVLATGLPRRAHLSLTLPGDLKGDSLLVIRAQLELFPDSSLLFGMSPDDVNDNAVGGLPAVEEALTVDLRALDAEPAAWADLDGGDMLKEELPVFEENLVYYEGTSILHLRSRQKEPLVLPLTRWVQDWANGERENLDLTLLLGGEDERLRRLGWFIEHAQEEYQPRLEILYAWSPDFD